MLQALVTAEVTEVQYIPILGARCVWIEGSVARLLIHQLQSTAFAIKALIVLLNGDDVVGQNRLTELFEGKLLLVLFVSTLSPGRASLRLSLLTDLAEGVFSGSE